MSAKRFVLLARGSRARAGDTACGLLFETAPDSSLRPAPPVSVVDAKELLGPREWAEDRAAVLVRKLIPSSPTYCDVNVLEIGEEQLMHEFVKIFQVIRIYQYLSHAGFDTCVVRGDLDLFDRLVSVQQALGCPYQIEFQKCDGKEVNTKLRAHWQSQGLRSLIHVARLALRRILPSQTAWLEARMMKKTNVVPGGLWFYGAAYNTSGIGAEYGRALPDLKHAYADIDEGGRKLKECGLAGIPIFQFVRFGELPSRRVVRELADKIAPSIENAPLQGEDAHVRDIYLRSAPFNYFVCRLLPWFLAYIVAAKRMLQVAKPDVLVVGNAAYERPLLLSAQLQPITRVMLQHGVVHSYYRVLDQPIDYFLVRGEFFRDCLGPQLRSKATVLDSPGSNIQPAIGSEKRDIVFISSPVEVEPRADARELPEIISVLLRESLRCGRRLVIRVHPTENVATYKALFAKHAPELSAKADIVYSHRSGLDDVIRSAALVVLYHSTVFLNCIAAGVPIVSFGWHEFPFKSHYEHLGIFNFAASLEELSTLIRKGIEGELPSPSGQLNCFLRPTESHEIRHFFDRITARGAAQ